MSEQRDSELSGKKVLTRKLLRGILSGLNGNRRESAAEGIRGNLIQMKCWTDARSILAFLSFGAEISTHPVIHEAVRNGKSVYVPAVTGPLLEFRRIKSPDESLEKGVLGIREPRSDAPIWSLSGSPGPTLILVPGLGFDSTGARLGRGGGYYDRFIASVRLSAGEAGERPPLFIGICCREQVLSELPVEEHDQRLDGLVTDGFAGLFRK